MLVLFNVFAFLLSIVVFNKSFIEQFKISWLLLIGVPIIQGISMSIYDKSGVLLIKENNNADIIFLNLKEYLKKEYIEVKTKDNSITYKYKSKWKKYTHFNKGIIIISLKNNIIEINARKVFIQKLESKLRWGKQFKNY